MTRRRVLALLAALALLPTCSGSGDPQRELKIAVTTSTRDSGLLDVLLPIFEAREDCKVLVIAKGTGAALKEGAEGNVDAILVHAPEREKRFVAEGHGVARVPFMESDFLIVGPAADPAEIEGLGAAEAAARLAGGTKGVFVSRGDDSGTHTREKALWSLAGARPGGERYVESGRGMGATLTMADQMLAYTLVDRGTFAAFAARVELVELVSGDPLLANPYAAIRISEARRPRGEADLARAFVEFLAGEEAQRAIAGFRIDGVRVFRPRAEMTAGD